MKDKEAIALHKLAKLYVQTNEPDKAAVCFAENLKRREQEDVHSSETIEALNYLARYYRDQRKIEAALEYVTKLIEVSPAGMQRDEAYKLYNELQIKY